MLSTQRTVTLMSSLTSWSLPFIFCLLTPFSLALYPTLSIQIQAGWCGVCPWWQSKRVLYLGQRFRIAFTWLGLDAWFFIKCKKLFWKHLISMLITSISISLNAAVCNRSIITGIAVCKHLAFVLFGPCCSTKWHYDYIRSHLILIFFCT